MGLNKKDRIPKSAGLMKYINHAFIFKILIYGVFLYYALDPILLECISYSFFLYCPLVLTLLKLRDIAPPPPPHPHPHRETNTF